jgi:hypothetical protein
MYMCKTIKEEKWALICHTLQDIRPEVVALAAGDDAALLPHVMVLLHVSCQASHPPWPCILSRE